MNDFKKIFFSGYMNFCNSNMKGVSNRDITCFTLKCQTVIKREPYIWRTISSLGHLASEFKNGLSSSRERISMRSRGLINCDQINAIVISITIHLAITLPTA